MKFVVNLKGRALIRAIDAYQKNLEQRISGVLSATGYDDYDLIFMLRQAEHGKPNKKDMGAWLLWSGLKAAAQHNYAITELVEAE